MKILHVIDSAGIYGAEIMLLNLMNEQKSSGHSPVLLSLGTMDEGLKELEIKAELLGIPVKQIRTKNGLSLILKTPKLIQTSLLEGVDIIHSHGYKGNILFGILPKYFRKISTVSTMHGWLATTRRSKVWIYEVLDRIFLNRLDAKIAVTINHPGLSSKWLKRKSADTVIENGIPICQDCGEDLEIFSTCEIRA